MKVIKAEDTRSLEPFRDRIIEGDCLEVMKGIPGESIDMILCDLPYGTTQNKWDSIIELDLLFTEYMRIIKPHGAIVLTSSGLFTAKHVKSDGSRYPTDIVYFKTAESEGAVYHPTQKPVELGRYLIRTYTNPGDIVLDNACGSGSFCVAAVLEGRSFIGIEKNEGVALFKKRPVDYIDICNQRIKEAKRTFEAEQQAIS